jgi:class 3 adenylate cyclase
VSSVAAPESTDESRSQGTTARLTSAMVMFADVVGFTAFSESIGLERAYFMVTGALRLLDGVARRHRGAVDNHAER